MVVPIAVPNIFEQDKCEKGCKDGVLRAIDGFLVDIAAPATTECLDELSCHSGAEKGYGINVRAITTANYRFSGMAAKLRERRTISPPTSIRLFPS